jgi:hypothetical protein
MRPSIAAKMEYISGAWIRTSHTAIQRAALKRGSFLTYYTVLVSSILRRNEKNQNLGLGLAYFPVAAAWCFTRQFDSDLVCIDSFLLRAYTSASLAARPRSLSRHLSDEDECLTFVRKREQISKENQNEQKSSISQSVYWSRLFVCVHL